MLLLKCNSKIKSNISCLFALMSHYACWLCCRIFAWSHVLIVECQTCVSVVSVRDVHPMGNKSRCFMEI